MSSDATLPESAKKRRGDYRRQLARRLAEVDSALDLMRERLGDGEGILAARARKLFIALRERRRDLDVAVDELMLVPEDDWVWQKRQVEDSRERLFELVDAALAEYVLASPISELTATRA
jgi:hypothetical protein